MRRRLAISLLLLALAALGLARTHVVSAETAAVGARLTAISSTADGGRAALLIESSEPVAYQTSQPDPGTVLVDLRNVTSAGYANGFAPRAGSPIRSVAVEDVTGAAGEHLARIRVALAGSLQPRIHSQRNLIFVEVGGAAADARPARVAAAGGEDDAVPTVGESADAPLVEPVTLKAVHAEATGDRINVVLEGTGKIGPGRVRRMAAVPPRFVIDLPNVTPDVPAVTTVDQGPVTRVRVAVQSKAPLVTRVVVDLASKAKHTMQASDDGTSLTLSFASPTGASDSPARPDAMSALAEKGTPAAAASAKASQAAPAQQPPPAAGAAGQSSVSRTGEKAYTGHPVSLDFQGADLRAVLRTFSEISGLNIVIDPTVQGSVDVSLRDVPWDQALDIILRANKLGYFVDGTIVRVAPLTVLADEEKARRKLAEEQALSGELRVMTRTLSYAKAEDLKPLLVKSALTQRGTVEFDPRTNTLIISDLQSALDTAERLITDLDRPQPQVEIEARIVQTTSDFARTIGVQWGFNGRADAALGNTSGLAFPNSGSAGGRLGTQSPNGTPNAVNLGVGAATSAVGLALGSVNGAFNIDVALSALEKSGQGRLLSSPRVSTQSNVEAEITQGIQIPIQTVANNTVTVTFKDAALTLKVTPQITASGTVIMKIVVENAAPDFSRAVGPGAIPPIDTQRALTQVLVSDGQTTVIGGIFVSNEQQTIDRTPALHRLPLLGWLFKRDGVTDSKRELLIFITPRILRTA
jgi:type IV pilus assembly protein PilQ